MFVKVFKLEEGEDALASFAIGTHVLGRGPALQCNDKRVSRNHATLEISEENIKITSTHINPCFLKMAGSKTVTILSKDSSTELHDGDTFAFLPDTCWFKIKVIEGDLPNSPAKEETEDKQGVKRHLNGSEEETEEKRRKVEDEKKDEDKKDNDQETASTSNNIEPSEVKQENDDTNINNSSSNEQVDGNKDEDVKKEETNNDNETQNEDIPTSSTAQTKPRREKCWYEAKCYRKNPEHRREFTHPGDSDFESDPEDNRPSCSYGAACYRKNKDHRKNYKHPPRDPPNKQKKKRTRKVNPMNPVDLDDLSDLSDDDPYEDDGDSDEYVEESDSEDSDYDDSQGVDEDSENVRRLVKEAKRFAKK